MTRLTDEQWQALVVTMQGRAVPATEVPWLRSREVCVHAADLATGLRFGDLPADFLAALCDDVIVKRGAGPSGQALMLVATATAARWQLPGLGQPVTVAGPLAEVIYCKDSRRRKPWDGLVSSGFLGYAFRPRDTMGKNGRFTGSGWAVSPKAVKRMSEAVSGWRFHRLTDLTGEQLTGWIDPVIRGWMAYYCRSRRWAGHAARQNQPPRPGMDQAQVPAAAALPGHEARLEPDYRPKAGAAAPLALGTGARN